MEIHLVTPEEPGPLLKLGQAYYDGLDLPDGDGAEKLEQEAARLRRKIETTQAMMQDSLLPYAKGKGDLRLRGAHPPD